MKTLNTSLLKLMLGFIRSIFIAVVSLGAASLGVAAEHDWPKNFPNARQVAEKQTQDEELLLPLAHLRRIDGSLQPGKAEWVEGDRWQRTFEIAKGHSPKEIFAHYKTQIFQSNLNLLFLCEGRSCGSSNHWANKIFRNAKLYGPEKNQRYLIARSSDKNVDIFTLIYVMQRGNKRNYVHIEKIATASLKEQMINPTASTLLILLAEQGELTLPNAVCGGLNQQSGDIEFLAILAAALKKNSTLVVDLVLGGKDEKIQACGDQLLVHLYDLGVRESQLALLLQPEVDAGESVITIRKRAK